MKAPVRMLMVAAAYAVFASGCASTSLNHARHDYFSGRYQDAARQLEKDDVTGKDRVLFKMERGMIRQAAGDYEGSSRDFISAFDDIEAMTAISVAEDTGSMIINDNVQDYRGAPFERTMLHAFTAINHLLMSNWENAAVEARRIIQSLSPEVKKDYPEDAFSRYMAGFCLELAGDWSNAALQYRLAGENAPGLRVDTRTGMVSPGTNSPPPSPALAPAVAGSCELVVFALMGRSPTGDELLNQLRPVASDGYAEIHVGGNIAGRTYELADTVELAFTTKEKDAIKEMAKTVSRIALKEAAAYQIEQNDELLGALFRIIMIGLLEQPDIRRWETLPRSLQVARVIVPENPQSIEVHFMTSSGFIRRTVPVEGPLPRKGRVYIAVVRDSQPVL